jgi:Dimerisation domain
MSADESSPRDTLLQMTNAFRASQAIYVAATLGIADLLEDGPRSVDELAQATGTHAPTLYRLLRALASVGVFTEEPDGQFGWTPMTQYLRTNAPRSLPKMYQSDPFPKVLRLQLTAGCSEDGPVGLPFEMVPSQNGAISHQGLPKMHRCVQETGAWSNTTATRCE